MTTYSVAERRFVVRVFGLRPNTYHDFYVDGVNRVADTKVSGRAQGADLISKPNGELTFDYMHTQQIPADTEFSDYIAYSQAINNLAGDKIVKIVSLDGNSKAQATITYIIEDSTEYFGA